MTKSMPRGTATDDMIEAHQNRIKQAAEAVPGYGLFVSGKLAAFGEGFASFGERYCGGKGRYCPVPGRCLADATVADIERRTGLRLRDGRWVKPVNQEKSASIAGKS